MIEHIQPLVLASGSPRRKELLEGAGLAFEVLAPPEGEEEGVDPSLPPGEGAIARALAKAAWVARQRSEFLVLGADTVVVLEDEVLGKPRDAEHARGMLASLSGRSHKVLTGFAVVFDGTARTRIVETQVSFRVLDEVSIGRYVDSGEPMDKAGAYAIQGLGGGFVDRVIGSYPNVVGLPLPEVLLELSRAGGIA
ncbi:MAG: septum formation protein Maf [Nitrospinaceae bacterium]|nr:septum formation protein Maf [Nitrospinaceae bacterium]